MLTTPTGLAVTPTYTYVTDQKTAGTVSVINTATGAVVKTIAVGSQPSAVAINPPQAWAYVTNRGSGTVSVIDTATNAAVGSAIGVGSSPQDVAVAQNDTITRIYVVNNSSSNVSVIDAFVTATRSPRSAWVGYFRTDFGGGQCRRRPRLRDLSRQQPGGGSRRR